MNNNNPIRILHIIGGMYYGGKESLIMNIYRKLDKEKIQFDFIVHSDKILEFHKEISNMGGRIFRIKKLSQTNIYDYIKEMTRIIKNNGPYYAVHSHMNHQSGINAFAARLANVKIRICHVHATDAGTTKNRILLPIYRLFINLYGTSKVACSSEAGKYIYRKKIHYQIINNGIDVDKFLNFNLENKIRLRRNLGIKDGTKIIGHIGRFIPVKNHEFLLRIFKKLLNDKDYSLILVGDGPDIEKIKSMCYKLGVFNKVHFLGVRNDIPELMNLFDIFVLPSFNEGLGIVLLEAQATGTQCIASSSIPKETDLGMGLVKYCSLDSSNEWVEAIRTSDNMENIVNNKKIKDQFILKEYDIQSTFKKFMELYNINY